ncbi:MAG TPA: hypothetical protein VJ302_34495, partial [Blastocatellia bacterium]|nr:hypothetical protein [Blastocatellia bacterium]
MDQYTFKVFQKTDQLFVLRLIGPDGALIDERELDPAEIKTFTDEVDRDYCAAGFRFSDLGGRLYRWLDGPAHR